MARHRRQPGAPPPAPARRPRSARRAALPDVLGVAWVVLAGVAVLVPALAHGSSLGTIDQLTRYGLSLQPGTVVHYTGPGDQIEMLIPWNSLAWTQVHHGHLPLWNPYSALGMPLAFNWQSAAFSVPALVGYLFPLRLAYTVVQIVTVLIAGTGAYFFSRVLRLGVVGAATAAVVFELSGPFVGWLGWPNSSAMSWAGWLFGATVLIVRGRHRARHVTLFALALAAAVYAGQPETVVLFAMALVVFVAVYLAFEARPAATARPAVRPLGDLVLGVLAGGALAAPLALPGLQVASTSIVRVASSYGALAPHNIGNLFFQGFDGLPVAGSRYFGNSIYPETAVYVGVAAVALALVALGTRRRRPEVPALIVTAVAMGAIAYAAPVVSVINSLTGLRSVAWHRSVQPMVFALAVLAGIGMDALDRAGREKAVRRWVGAAFAACGVVVLAIWLTGRGTLPSPEASIRAKSFVWPALQVGVGLAVAIGLFLAPRRTRAPDGPAEGQDTASASRAGALSWAAAVLLACETAFLVAAGAPLASSSPTFASPTPAEQTLQRAVGTALVGFAGRDCHTPPTLGIHQDINVLYGVHELADFDPMVPQATFTSLQHATGAHADAPGAPLILCPAVDDATTARLYGVGFILDHADAPAPAGTEFVARIADERLYRVPGSATATLTPLGPGRAVPDRDAPGKTLALRTPGPGEMRISTTASVPSMLRIHVTDLPGWHASIDGRPLPLTTFAGTMLQAHVGAGRHTIALHYWPTTFTIGLTIGAVALVVLVVVPVIGALRRRRRAPDTSQPETVAQPRAGGGRHALS